MSLILIPEVAKLGSFYFPEQCISMMQELGKWGAGGGGGKNDLALLSVFSLFSACHLQCQEQGVTGPRYMVRRRSHLILLLSSSV